MTTTHRARIHYRGPADLSVTCRCGWGRWASDGMDAAIYAHRHIEDATGREPKQGQDDGGVYYEAEVVA